MLSNPREIEPQSLCPGLQILYSLDRARCVAKKCDSVVLMRCHGAVVLRGMSQSPNRVGAFSLSLFRLTRPHQSYVLIELGAIWQHRSPGAAVWNVTTIKQPDSSSRHHFKL